MSTVLLIGSGGREHAIAWSLAKSPLVSRILLSPGNPGIARSDKVSLVSTDDAQDLCNLCTSQSVDLAVIGPEAPLTAGLADQLIRAGIPVFGPSKLAARIEGSKAFSKEFMERNGIPTAKFQVFTEFERAREFVEKNFDPEKGIVLKVSGLAAGKGVVLPRTLDEAVQTLKEFMVEKIFGDAGNEVVVEELLVGEEVSCLAFTDGFSISLCPPAQDHKRLLDNDEGPNTGGMGAYAPAPILTPELRNLVIEKVLKPAVDGLRKEGTPFVGILYAGVMICPQKEIPTQVLEFNCRFGDPETQCILPLLQSDLYKIMYACATRCLDSVEVRWAPAGSAAVTVIAASRGYPKQSFQPEVIDIKSQDDTNSVLFHAGTSENSKNELLASGGRVLAITGISEKGLSEALNIAYNRLSTVSFSGMQFRKDIAQKAFRSSDSKNLANKSPQSGDFALVLPTTAFSCTGLPYAHEYLKKFDWNEKRTDLGGASISESLSTPFPSYSDQFSLLKKHGVNIKAIIPVAGSSLMLSSQSLDSYLALLLEKGSWEIPQILKLIQREGNISDELMNQYMNMGIGSIFIVSQEDSSLAKKLIPEAVIAGKVIPRDARGSLVFGGTLLWQPLSRKVRLGILGSTRGTDMQAIIDAIANSSLNAEIAIVISNKKDAYILDRARSHNILAIHISGKDKSRDQFDRRVSEQLRALKVDLVVLIGYMRILSASFVHTWENRIINVHPSLLPEFAGGMDLNVHQCVIDARAKQTGCTVHLVDEGVDSGKILVQKRCDVLSTDTAETLKNRVQALEGLALIEAISNFSQNQYSL